MRITEAIAAIKGYCRGEMGGVPCSDDRDKILYGEPGERECTGIVAAVYGSVEVLQKAAEVGANLVIVVESIFWSHGDPVGWLQGNPVFEAKRTILDQNGIVVWRLHEYLRSGVRMGDGYVDPVNWGFVRRMNWFDQVRTDVAIPDGYESKLPYMWLFLDLDGVPAREVAAAIRKEFGSNAVPIVGDPETPVHRMFVPAGSILGFGGFDNLLIEQMGRQGIDTAIGLELVDFTLAGYVRDSCAVGRSRAILRVGHFVMEEAGMCYAPEWMSTALEEAAFGAAAPTVLYVNSGDPRAYLALEDER